MEVAASLRAAFASCTAFSASGSNATQATISGARNDRFGWFESAAASYAPTGSATLSLSAWLSFVIATDRQGMLAWRY